MSLINRMLKDLEVRGAVNPAGDEVLQGVRAVSAPARRLPPGWALVSSLVLLGAGAFWLLPGAPVPPPLLPSAAPAVVAPACIVPAPAPAVAPAAASRPAPLAPPAPAPSSPAVLIPPQATATAVVVTASAAPRPWIPPRELAAVGDKDKTTAAAPPAISAEERGERAWRLALAALERGEEQRGLEALREVLAAQPLRRPARLLLAERLVRRGGGAAAGELLAAGLTLDDDAFDLRRALAQWHANRGESAAALALLTARPLPAPGDDPDARALLGALRQRTADFSGAATAYREALTARPRHGGYWLGFALALESDGRRDEALNAYDEALRGEGLGGALRPFAEERRAILSGARRP